MVRSTPVIQDNTLFSLKDGQSVEIVVGSEQWFEWLTRSTSTIFSFHSTEGFYTARKETAGNHRGGQYWKAYRKHQGTLYRAYLGRAEDLTLERLKETAQTLTSRIQKLVEETLVTLDEVQPELKDYNRITLLLETKLQPPRLPAQLVERTQLMALLDRGTKHKLTLLQAPAGFGKTTLVSQWLAHRQIQSTVQPPSFFAWVSLDSGDNDPVRFWSAIISAYRSFQDQLGQTALAQLFSTPQILSNQTFLETVLTLLINDLSRSGKPGALILEDYHFIEHPRIHETLAFFIEHLPALQYIIILTRSTPPLPLVRWRAKGDLFEIQSNQLHFSPEETSTFVQQNIPQTLSGEAIQALHRYLEGWAAGLRLLALSLQSQMTPTAIEKALMQLNSGSTRTQRAIQEYFLSEVLAVQPEPLQLFLLQTSILSRLNSSLCEAVTGRADSARWLELAFNSGFFLEALDSNAAQLPLQSQQWYRYHGLFAEAMRAEAVHRLGETRLQLLSSRASHWYEAHTMPVEAIEAALTAGEFERAAILIEKVNEKSYFSEQHTMRRWLAQFPEQLLHSRPTLCFLYALANIFSHDKDFAGDRWKPEAAESLLRLAEEGWRNQGDMTRVGVVYAFRTAVNLLYNFSDTIIAHATRALELLPSPTPEFKHDQSLNYPIEWVEWRCVCVYAIGIKMMQEGSFDKAHPLFLEVYKLSLKIKDTMVSRITGWLLGNTYFAMGELHQAESYFQRTLPLSAVDEEGGLITRANSILGLIQLSYEWNELEKAEQLTQEALLYDYKGEFFYWEEDVHLKIKLLQFLLRRQRGESMATIWQELSDYLIQLQTRPELAHLTFEVYIWQARQQLGEHELLAAGQTLNNISQNEKNLTPVQEQRVKLLKARLLLARGEAESALNLLEGLLDFARKGKHGYRVLEIRLVMALVYSELNQEPASRQHLVWVLSQAHREGFLRLFLDEGEMLANLLRALLPTLTEKPLRTYLQAILQAFRNPLATSSRSISTPFLPEPLSPQENRILALLAKGKSNPEIARDIVVSINTVKDHVKHLYRKLEVNNRVEAVAVARQLNLI